MQIDRETDLFVAVPLDYADAKAVGVPVGRNADGSLFAEKQIVYFKKKPRYKGEVLICIKNGEEGEALALATLWQIKPVSSFSEAEWGICVGRKRKRGFGGFLREIRPVIPFNLPVTKPFDVVLTVSGAIFPYPQYMVIGAEGARLIQRKLQSQKK